LDSQETAFVVITDSVCEVLIYLQSEFFSVIVSEVVNFRMDLNVKFQFPVIKECFVFTFLPRAVHPPLSDGRQKNYKHSMVSFDCRAQELDMYSER